MIQTQPVLSQLPGLWPVERSGPRWDSASVRTLSCMESQDIHTRTWLPWLSCSGGSTFLMWTWSSGSSTLNLNSPPSWQSTPPCWRTLELWWSGSQLETWAVSWSHNWSGYLGLSKTKVRVQGPIPKDLDLEWLYSANINFSDCLPLTMSMSLMMTLLSQLISTCLWWILTLSTIFTTSLTWEHGSLSTQTPLISGEQRTSSIFVNLSVQHWQGWNIQSELDCHERRSVENYNWLQSFQCRHWKPCTTLQVATHNNINIFICFIYRSIGVVDDNSVWYTDQLITTFSLLQHRICSVPGQSGLWRLPSLQYDPEFSDNLCWHGRGYKDCNKDIHIVYQGCKWWT